MKTRVRLITSVYQFCSTDCSVGADKLTTCLSYSKRPILSEAAKAHVVSYVDLLRNHKQTGLIADRKYEVKEILDSENWDRPDCQALMGTEPSNQGRKWTDFWRELLQCVSEESGMVSRVLLVSAGCLSMMRSCFVFACFVALSGFLMMSCRVFVMFRRFVMMLCCFF